MTIAREFAEIYYDYMLYDNGYLSDWVTHFEGHEVTIKDIVVSMYWKISEAYDLLTHAPLPDEWWLPYMNYNMYCLIDYVRYNYEGYNIHTFKHALEDTSRGGWMVTVNPETIFRLGEYDQ